MAADDDNFDIDIYGDGTDNAHDPDPELILDAPENLPASNNGPTLAATGHIQAEASASAPAQPAQQVSDSAPTSQQQAPVHNLPAFPQGTKRKEYDDQPTDPDATTALLIKKLNWWDTEDNIREWVKLAGVEESQIDAVTFNEHKINGKSKEEAFIKFNTLQATTASKKHIETSGSSKLMVTYTSPHPNPFKTLPKDASMHLDRALRNPSGGHPNHLNNQSGGFRGGRGNYNKRGMGNMGFNPRQHNQMPFQGGPNPNMGNFHAGPMSGFNYGYNRGGPMMGGPGPYGRGRGGNMGNPGMMNMHMGGMNPMSGMNPMAMNPMMNMGPNNMNMGQPPFQGGPAQQPYNQGQARHHGNYYNNNQGSAPGYGASNPHGAKRSRQE